MSSDFVETLFETKDFKNFKDFVDKCLDNINEFVIKSEKNSLNLLHFCVGNEDNEFSLKCLKHLLSLSEVEVNCLAKIENNLISSAHLAVQWSRYRALHTLIDSGIDLFICDSYGLTVYDYAINKADERSVQLIETAIKSCFMTENNNSLLVKNNQNDCNQFNTNANKEEKSLNCLHNSFELKEKSEQNSSQTNCEDLEQTVIYFNENDFSWKDIEKNSFISCDSDNCSENTLISNISYEKSDSIKSCSSDRTEIYVYNDRDHNVVLIEERHEPCVDKTASLEALNNSDVISKGFVSQTYCEKQLNEMLRDLNETQIYNELRAMGDSPGPVIQSTKPFYIKRLFNIRRGKCSPTKKTLPLPQYSQELNRLIDKTFPFDEALKLEKQLTDFFKTDSSKRNYFNYILLDPNIGQNIAFEANSAKIVINSCTQIDMHLFVKYIKSIFYIGKGQGNRVYEHFYEAIKSSQTNSRQKRSEKVERILKIWSADKGVISLHCFHDSSSDEALAREAMIIDALMLSNLTNQVNGQNKCKLKWTERKRRIFGSYLVYKSFLIHLLSGERQIRRPTVQ